MLVNQKCLPLGDCNLLIGLLNECPCLKALFKVSQLKNYFLKKFNTSISDVINAQFSIKIDYLKFLNNVIRALFNISLINIVIAVIVVSITLIIHHAIFIRVYFGSNSCWTQIQIKLI